MNFRDLNFSMNLLVKLEAQPQNKSSGRRSPFR
jgi:hypothetical protein